MPLRTFAQTFVLSYPPSIPAQAIAEQEGEIVQVQKSLKEAQCKVTEIEDQRQALFIQQVTLQHKVA
jgi:hypothetical protein